MNSKRRNIDILRKILKYCDQIDQAKDYFGNSFDALKANIHYQNATAMCILQIGELAGHLSEDFRTVHTEIPWRAIKNMRNIAVHNYGDFSMKVLWDTVTDDIPALRDYCGGIVRQNEVLEQEAIEAPDEDMEQDEEQEQGMKLE